MRTTTRRSTYATPACGNNESHVCTSRGHFRPRSFMEACDPLNIGRTAIIMEGTKRTWIGSVADVFFCARCSMPTRGQRLLAEALLPAEKGLLCVYLTTAAAPLLYRSFGITPFSGETHNVFFRRNAQCQCFYREKYRFHPSWRVGGVRLDEATRANAVGSGWRYFIKELAFKNNCN